MAINKSVPGTKNSAQNDVNWSFDEDFGVLATEGLVYNPVTGTMDRLVQPGEALPTAGTNPSLALTYDGSNQVTNIAMTIGGITYNKVLTWVANNCTAVSSWT